jgi:tRNA-specific 2-thiouridylase
VTDKPVKAIAMISSGLDSMLAAKIMRDQGIDVLGLHCVFRFDPTTGSDTQTGLEKLFEPVGIPIRVEEITEPFFQMVLNPPHGYGKGVNPCIDCKIFMFRHAKRIMEETDAQFLITGEVVAQRPMSQHKPTLFHIEKQAGLQRLIVRPLSARILPPTLPEEKGWIHRDQLYEISGRNRREQMALAESFGIRTYNQPAGGCVLTDPAYAKRAKVLLRHRDKSTLCPEDFNLLRLGRHFWMEEGLHVVVGRHEKDNEYLESFRSGRWAFEAADVTGPLVLAEGIRHEDDLRLAAGITARYCGRSKAGIFRIRYKNAEKSGILDVEPLPDETLNPWRI